MKKLFSYYLLFNLVFPQNVTIKYPDFEENTLQNGLTTYVAKHTEQPAVFFKLLIPLGEFDLPSNQKGLASMTADMLSKGTQTYNADEFSEAIESTGGSLFASGGDEYTTISGRFLKEDLSLGLELLSEMLIKPTFPKDEWKLLKRQASEAVKTWHSDAMTVALAHLYRLGFGDVPIGNIMTKSLLKNIDLKKMKSFHERLVPQNSIFVLIGDIEISKANELINQTFEAWKAVDSNQNRVNISFADINGIRFRLIDNPELEQATIGVGFKGIPSNHEERHALNLVNYIFGGHFSSRLNKTIRAEGGKTYGISSQWKSYRDFGILGIMTSTRVEEVRNTYDLIINEMQKLVDSGITEDELVRAKSYITGSFPLRFESPTSYADRVASNNYYGFTMEDRKNVIINRNAVTLNKANEIARKYYSPENIILVIVGNQKIIKDKVSDIGSFDEAYYKDDPK